MAHQREGHLIRCYVQGNLFPAQLANEHHIWPQEAGGPDTQENKCWLCPTCHQSLHRLEELLEKGKAAQAKDLAGLVFKDPEHVKKIMFLATEAMRRIRDFRENVPEDAHADKAVTFSLDVTEYAHLKAIACELKVGGRRATVPDFVAMLVRRHLKMAGRGGG